MSLNERFEMTALPEADLKRIKLNIEEGKAPKFVGDCKLYVGNMSFGCDESDIRELFEEYGDVGDVSLVRDEDGRMRGFGFVTMRNQDDGEKCLEALDGTEFNGRNIAVREATN